MRVSIHSVFLAALMLTAACAAPAIAQPFPSKPIRIVVPLVPGGMMDITTRVIAGVLGEQLGQQILVENRPGGGTNIGTDLVAKSPPDGYTLLMFGDAHTIAPALYAMLNHDPVTDFVPITLLVTGPHILVAHPSLPVNNLKELIDYAKQNPSRLSYASPGNGSAQHLGMEMFKARAGLQIQHIPYKGGGQAIVDVVAGHVKLGMFGLLPVLPYVKTGKLKAVAVTSKRRAAILPAVPTLDESGLAGYETLQWYGVVAPAGTPVPVIDRLHAEFVKAMRNTVVRERMTSVGLDVVTSDKPEDFAKFIQDDVPRWPAIVKAIGAKVD